MMLSYSDKFSHPGGLMVQFGRQLHRRGGPRSLLIGIVLASALLIGGALLLLALP